ncbi:MAG: fructose-specific PTS transporter subunit EIIC [Liquorilactobacillus nagelii]|jgi:PTS system fructose-specific IIC component/fructose-specific PTS system IIC-like component|uniref:PTS fructose transporter subunit IIC n=1 Tax=Liquorilactobacillus nagelii TaxID=82688 RepID=UPI002432858F|nr:fructose-specific PTS transporter subunit EIIC [Liquorilactobacillus nagelii]MCI1632777.1 fructose-specific PTS transporter subunit EIIC [Liquorilactobacillus nagelii]
MNKAFSEIKNHAMTGVSYMIPTVTVGGILYAIALAFSGGVNVKIPFLANIETIGAAGMALLVPVLAGYISYSIAGRPGLVPGLILGYLAANPVGTGKISTGFLGGLLLGFSAGYLAKWVKKWKVPAFIKPLMPIIVIPLVVSLIIGLLYIYIIATPLGSVVSGITSWLKNMSTGSSIVLAIIVGCMISFDMGGPLNKIAYTTAVALISTGNGHLMGMAGVAICIPPIGLGLSSLILRSRFSEEERNSGKAAIVMGACGITEGAIPFAATDPFRVIPSIMIGSATGSVIASLGSSTNMAPLGGLLVLPVVGGRLTYVLGVVVGIVVVIALMALLKKPIAENEV